MDEMYVGDIYENLVPFLYFSKLIILLIKDKYSSLVW